MARATRGLQQGSVARRGRRCDVPSATTLCGLRPREPRRTPPPRSSPPRSARQGGGPNTDDGWAANGHTDNPLYWQVAWSVGQSVNRVRLLGRPGTASVLAGHLLFSDNFDRSDPAASPAGPPLDGGVVPNQDRYHLDADPRRHHPGRQRRLRRSRGVPRELNAAYTITAKGVRSGIGRAMTAASHGLSRSAGSAKAW